jgi:hypothetical protein
MPLLYYKIDGNYPLILACQYENYNSFAIMLMERFLEAITRIDWYQHIHPFHVVVDEGNGEMLQLVIEHATIDLINDPYSGTKMPELTPLQYIT